jgi:predicted small secreted protein
MARADACGFDMAQPQAGGGGRFLLVNPRRAAERGRLQNDGETVMRILLITLALLGLTACETTKGAGKDIQKAGQAISGAAQDVQDSL